MESSGTVTPVQGAIGIEADNGKRANGRAEERARGRALTV